MARLIKEVVLNQPGDFVQYIMTDFLSKHRFSLEQFKGEQVYRVGSGLLEMPKFLTWRYQNGVFHLEAWTRAVWLPGVYGKENDLSGFFGAVPKSTYKKDIEDLMGLLFQPLSAGGPNPGMGAASQPGGLQSGGPNTVYVRGTDMSRYATTSLIFSLIALIGILVPLFGVIFGALGITYGNRGRNSVKRGMATAGFVIGIIAVIISVVSWILNIVYMM